MRVDPNHLNWAKKVPNTSRTELIKIAKNQSSTEMSLMETGYEISANTFKFERGRGAKKHNFLLKISKKCSKTPFWPVFSSKILPAAQKMLAKQGLFSAHSKCSKIQFWRPIQFFCFFFWKLTPPPRRKSKIRPWVWALTII